MSDIPFNADRLLAQIGPESEAHPWKRNFYIRQIKTPIAYFIESDFENLQGLDRAKALKTFVENAQKNAEKPGELGAFLNQFDITAIDHFPGIVTRNFVEGSNAKATAKSAFENLILLETVYSIETLIKNQEAQSDLNFEWQTIKTWANVKKSSLTPSEFKHWVSVTKYILVGNSIEDAINWVWYIAPFIAGIYVKHIINAVRNFPSSQTGILGNVVDLITGFLQTGFIAASFLLSPVLQTMRFLARITSLPFVGLRKLFVNYPTIKSLLFISELTKNYILFDSLLFYVWPIMNPAFLYSLGIFSFAALGMGTLTFILHHVLKAFKPNVNFIQNESVVLSFSHFMIVVISAFTQGTRPESIRKCADEGKDLWNTFKTLYQYEKENKLTDRENHREDNLAIRRAHLENLNKLGVDLSRFAETYFGISLSIPPSIRSASLGLQEPAAANQPDYDREALTRKMIIMKLNLAKTEIDHGADVAAALRDPLAAVPLTYLQQFKTIAELPEALRKLAVPPKPSEPEALVDELDAYVVEPVPLRPASSTRSVTEEQQFVREARLLRFGQTMQLI